MHVLSILRECILKRIVKHSRKKMDREVGTFVVPISSNIRIMPNVVELLYPLFSLEKSVYYFRVKVGPSSVRPSVRLSVRMSVRPSHFL